MEYSTIHPGSYPNEVRSRRELIEAANELAALARDLAEAAVAANCPAVDLHLSRLFVYAGVLARFQVRRMVGWLA